MIGVIDVGGGTRGSYGAGVLDRCLEDGVHFDYGIGVSAGSANIASYIAGQKGRNYMFYTEFAFRKEYMSTQQLLKNKNYINLEYIYATLSNHDGESPLDYEAIMKSDQKFKIVCTDAETGKPVYFDKSDMAQDDYGAIKGSCSVPVAVQAYEWKGVKLYDGGVSDPIPYQKAFDDGCDRLVVILTRPKNYFRLSKKDKVGAKVIESKYPLSAQTLLKRSDTYNRELVHCLDMEQEGKVLIVAPQSVEGMGTLTQDKDKIRDLYNMGYEDGKAIRAFVNQQ